MGRDPPCKNDGRPAHSPLRMLGFSKRWLSFAPNSIMLNASGFLSRDVTDRTLATRAAEWRGPLKEPEQSEDVRIRKSEPRLHTVLGSPRRMRCVTSERILCAGRQNIEAKLNILRNVQPGVPKKGEYEHFEKLNSWGPKGQPNFENEKCRCQSSDS